MHETHVHDRASQGADSGSGLASSPAPGTKPLSVGDADPTIADLEDIYLRKALVLVAATESRRDPGNPVDVHRAEIGPDERRWQGGPTGPMWRAGDYYTGAEFDARRTFAQTIGQWSGRDAESPSGWAILSPENGVEQPFETIKPYETTFQDIGGDECDPDHRVDNPFHRRRPDGREIVTEMDRWAASVATALCRWVAQHRERGMKPWENTANTLLVLGDEETIDELRTRGVFEYGIARMTGNPNEGTCFPLQTRFLTDLGNSETSGDRLAWLSDALNRLDIPEPEETAQAEVGSWTTQDERCCDRCGAGALEASLVAVAGEVVCQECQPERCARCDEWTHETGIGGYPLCEECQTSNGGIVDDPLDAERNPTEQTPLVSPDH